MWRFNESSSTTMALRGPSVTPPNLAAEPSTFGWVTGRPNIVLFMPDQLRADAVGAFGSAVAKTPHIDALAARGTSFSDAYSQHSVCGPSRVSMFTGW